MEKERGIVRLYVLADVDKIDKCVMCHAREEIKKVLVECLLDLAVYCESDDWKVTAEVYFERV